MKPSCAVVVILAAAAIAVASAGGQEDSFVYFLRLPDGTRLELDLPGEMVFATEEMTGTLVPVYSAAQSAKIAVELAIRERVHFLPRALTGMRMGPGSGQLQGVEEGDGYVLCLRIARPWVHRLDPPTEIPPSVSIDLPGAPRYAFRKSDDKRLLLFTVDQAEKIFTALTAAGLTIPEAAVAISGFLAPDTPGIAQTPLQPDCNECQAGLVCDVGGKRDCCSHGQGRCQTCNLCSTDITLDVSVGD